MRISENGNSVYLEVGIWLDPNGSIHLASREIEGFHVAVNEDPKRKNGHPTLYRRLAECLRQAGAPAPKLVHADARDE